MPKKLRVVLTGDTQDKVARLAVFKKLRPEVEVRFLPTIDIVAQKLSPRSVAALKRIDQYDYVLFTSPHGAAFFAQALKRYNIAKTKQFPKILAASAHKRIIGKTILFPRSAIAPMNRVRNLRAQGARVTVLPLYTTLPIPIKKTYLTRLFEHPVDYIIFMSSSSVESFSKNLRGSMLKQYVLGIPALCLGAPTAHTAKNVGFKQIHIATKPTIQGIIHALS